MSQPVLPVRPMRKSRLVTNASTYVLGNLLRKLVGFLLIPIYTRALTPDDYGIVGLTTAVGGLLGIMMALGISSAVARYYFEYANRGQQLREYITTNFMFVLACAGIVVVALCCWGEPLWERATAGQVSFRPFVPLMLWGTFAGLVLDLPMQLYQTQQKAKQFMTVQLTSFSLTLAATILFVVVLRMGARGQLLGVIVGDGITATVTSFFLLRQWFAPGVRWEYLKASLLFGLPLVPHMLSGWAMAAADRLILEHFVPLDQLGIYSLAYSLGMVMATLTNSINKAWAPHYYDFMQRNDRPDERVIQAVSMYIALIGSICLAGALFCQEIVVILTPQRYHATSPYVPLILFAYLLQGYYFFSVAPLFFHKKTRLLPWVTALSALVNIILNILFDARHGIMAAVWATVIAYAVSLGLTYALGQRQQHVCFPMRRYALVNGMIFAGVLLATYVFPGQVSVHVFLTKLTLLALFALVAYLTLVRPLGADWSRLLRGERN